MQKIILVQEVDYDGYKIGRCVRSEACGTPEAVARTLVLYTKPVRYGDGEREFKPHIHTERNSNFVIGGFVGPIPTFVFTTEKEILE